MASVPFMKPPEPELTIDVGDTVEVFCDHEKNGERIRGWLRGIVVQVDSKMVAVQFRSNVLFDRWLDGARSYSLVSGQFSSFTSTTTPAKI